MEIVHVYTKKRSEFGRQCIFNDRPAEINCDIAPNHALLGNLVGKNPIDRQIQNVQEMAEHEANTERFETFNRGINHTEGGWPKDINANEIEQVMRFRKKVEKDEMYVCAATNLTELVENSIKQNNSIDIYEDYFDNIENDTDHESPYAKTINVFRDPNEEPRNAHYISWYTDGPTKIAVAYCTIDFQSDKSNQSKNSYIWDVENPSKPEMSLKPNSSLICLDYNPKDSHILVGGQMNGQISYWDTRKGSRPVESTPIAVSHHDPVYSTLWLQSKSGSEFFSTSTDGCVLWWDIRKLNEPIEKTILDPTKKNDPTKAHGAYCLEYESTIPTKFMAATEFGTIFSCNRKAKTPQEKIVAVYSGHHGAIYSLQRNPYFIKNFLTVGDWTARIWSEDHRDHAIWWTDFDSTQIMSGGWSPTRPGVFYTAKENGYVDIWDLIFKQKAPTLSIQVTDSPLYCAKISENGALIATGARNGTTTLLRLSDGLVNMQRNEKALVSSIFERETRREKIIETRHREMKLKERVKSATLDEEENDNYKQMVNDIDAEFEIIIEEKGERDGKIKKMFEEIENWGNTKSVEEELPSNE